LNRIGENGVTEEINGMIDNQQLKIMPVFTLTIDGEEKFQKQNVLDDLTD
jgi:hypothetical protein